MGVEFILKNNGTEVSLNHTDFNILEPAFEFLKSKTGLFVDEYSDGRISPDHAKLLYQFINERVDVSGRTSLVEFKALLVSSSNKNLWVEYIGE